MLRSIDFAVIVIIPLRGRLMRSTSLSHLRHLGCCLVFQVELVKITTPEDSKREHEALTQHAEAVLKVSPLIMLVFMAAVVSCPNCGPPSQM